MESNKQADTPEGNLDSCTPRQRAILGILQWGASTASFVAMLFVMYS